MDFKTNGSDGAAYQDKERMLVAITTSGIYKVSPIAAEYKQFDNFECIKLRFGVDFGSSFSCYVDKTIFFKTLTQIQEEMSYVLKFLAPELLEKKYGEKTFKGYAEKLCADITSVLKESWVSKNRITLQGKIRKRKDKKFAEFEDYIPLTGDFRNNYLATLDDQKSLWWSKWELEHCEMPFQKISEKAPAPNTKLEVVDAFSVASESMDDLPF